MPLSSEDLQYQVFGRQGCIYPGHPVSIAYLIMRSYPDFEAASTRKEGRTFPNALGSGAIPGAGGTVYAALDTLKRALIAGVDAAFAYGDQYWASEATGPYASRLEEGQRQADSIKDDFRVRFAAWSGARAAAGALSDTQEGHQP